MLVAANIYTLQMKRLLERWKIDGVLASEDANDGAKELTAEDLVPKVSGEAPAASDLMWTKPDYRFPEDGELGPSCVGDTSFHGKMVVYDWDTRELLWEHEWGNMLVTPSGFTFADGSLYLSDLEAAHIFKVDASELPGRLLERISHPYLNDIHSLERTCRGLLVTCSGTDLVLELDTRGRVLYEWWANEHGFTATPSGHDRASGRNQEHRDKYYHTKYHATHVNDATFRDEDERYLLAVLFHQGQVIEIDRSLPPDEQDARVLLDGLSHPHGLEKIPGGWLIANTSAHELLLLDEQMEVSERIAYEGGWIQDCTRLSNGNLLLNDVDLHRIVELRSPGWDVERIVPYQESWRMGELMEISEQYADRLRAGLERRDRKHLRVAV